MDQSTIQSPPSSQHEVNARRERVRPSKKTELQFNPTQFLELYIQQMFKEPFGSTQRTAFLEVLMA